MALVAVGLLGWMARYYSRLLPAEGAPLPPPAGSQATQAQGFDEADVDIFIEIRRRLKQESGDWPPEDPSGREVELTRLRSIRDALLEEGAMASETYLEVRRTYRIWRRGGPGLHPSRLRMFEERRRKLQAVDLESLEPYDL